MASPKDADIFRSLFVAYPDALIVTDTAGTIVLANAGAEELLGYAKDELVGCNVDTLVPDAVRPRHARYREAYGHAPRPRPMGIQTELVAKRRDGTTVMVEIALSPLQSLGLPLVVTAIRGVGAYPRVKQALRRARYSDHLAQFGRLAVDARDTSLLLRDIPAIAVQALEVEVAAVYLLDAGRRSFRLAASVGLPNVSTHDTLPNREPWAPAYVIRSGRPTITAHALESRFALSEGEDWAGMQSGLMVPLFDRGEGIGVLAAHSTTKDRFAEDEIRFLESLSSLLSTSLQRAQSEERLSHAQRLEAVGQLTGGIAHDFNNLLTIIQGNLQILEELPVVADDALAAELVSAAARATHRGADLTGKLLAFSRRQRLTPESFDPAALLESLAALLRRTFDSRVGIEVEQQHDGAAVTVDAVQLESALLNIAFNARDAMPDGGVLRIETRRVERIPDHVLGPIESTPFPGVAAYLQISVADNGSGMSEAVKERAFEPFFTTKESGRGTGLGLSTVYGFMQQSKGAIALDSEPGRGTRIALYLPMAPPAATVAERAQSAEAGSIRELRVLLVEDEADVRAIAMRFLGSWSCDVTACTNGDEAIAHLSGPRPFDILVSDVALGSGPRGPEVAARAQRLRGRLPVVLVSGYSSELLDADRASPPEWELLQKPYSREQLREAIDRALEPPASASMQREI